MISVLKHLNKNTILAYLALYELCKVSPYFLKGYLATKISHLELSRLAQISKSQVTQACKALLKKGLIQKPKDRLTIYILGERKTINTDLGPRNTEVWYYDQEVTPAEKEQIISFKSNAKDFNMAIKEIRDFYFQLYEAKFKEKPVANFPAIHKSLDNLLRQQFNPNLLKACILPFLELDDEWLKKRGYPLQNLPFKLNECRATVKHYFKFYNLTEEQYYQKYINDIIKKYKINGGHNSKHNSEQNPKPENSH